MKPNNGVRGRGNRARGGGLRGRSNWNNCNVRPRYTNNWGRYKRPPPYFSPANMFPSPFFNLPPPPLPPRPPSPLPGTEEYRQRNIQETSELIKRHLNLDGTTGDEPFLLNTGVDDEKANEDRELEKSGDDQEMEKSSEVSVNPATPSTKKNKTARRPKSPVDADCDVDEIHNKIIKHISKLSYSKKINFVNQGLTGYDVAVQQLQIQKRLELSRALRDMSSRTQNSADCEVINSIIPDIGIKIEDLPREVIARLSSTLGIELNQENAWCSYQSNEDTPNLTPETLKKNTESESQNPLDSICATETNNASKKVKQYSGLFKGRRFSDSCSDDEDILDDILNTHKSSSSSTDTIMDNMERRNDTYLETADDKNPIGPDISDSVFSKSEELDSNQPPQKPPFPLIKLRPTKDLLKITSENSSSCMSNETNTLPQEISGGEFYQPQIPLMLENVSDNSYVGDEPEPQIPDDNEFNEDRKPIVSHIDEINISNEDVKPSISQSVKLDRSQLSDLTKTDKRRMKRQRSMVRRVQQKTKKLSRKYKRKLRRKDTVSPLEVANEKSPDDTPTIKHWRSAGEKKELPTNLPLIEHSHNSPVIPFAIFPENHIPKASTSTQTDPKMLNDASCQCGEPKVEMTSRHTQTRTDLDDVEELRKRRRKMLSQIAEIEEKMNELMKSRLSLYSQFLDDSEIIEMEQSRKRKCDSSPSSGNSSKRTCLDEQLQTESHSSSTHETVAACNVAPPTPAKESKVSRKSTRQKNTSTSLSNESNKPVTEEHNSSPSHRSNKSKAKEKTKKDDCEISAPICSTVAGEPSGIPPAETNLPDVRRDGEALFDVPHIPANNNVNDRVPPLPDESGTDCVGLNQETGSGMDFKDWSGSILVIEIQRHKVVSGNDEGTLYFHDLKTGKQLKSLELGKTGITSIRFPDIKVSHKFYVGTFDSKLHLMNSRRMKVSSTYDLDDNPVQCVETNWGMLFIGATNGNVIRFSIKKNKIEDTISISQNSILTLRAVQEGARRVLLVATRHSPVTVRDAMSGLLMRTMESTSIPTIYSLLFHDNKVYCGTSQQDILVYTFHNGEFASKYDKGRSSGVVCMNVIRNVLFAGCYNGNIYAYNTKTKKFIASMVGPAGLFLSMTATEDKIILATKMNHFKALEIPQNIKKEMS